MVRLPRHTRAPLYLAAAAALAACSTEGSTNPASAFSRPLFAVGDLTNSTVTAGVFKVCKSGSDGTFTVAVAGGQTVAPHSVVVAQGTCQSVAEFNGTGVLANVTVTETSPNFLSVTAQPSADVVIAGRTVTGFINFYHGVTATYVNSAPSGCVDDDDKKSKGDDKGKKDGDDCKKKKCDADKSLKDPKRQDENHDCRSETGEQKDKNYKP